MAIVERVEVVNNSNNNKEKDNKRRDKKDKKEKEMEEENEEEEDDDSDEKEDEEMDKPKEKTSKRRTKEEKRRRQKEQNERVRRETGMSDFNGYCNLCEKTCPNEAVVLRHQANIHRDRNDHVCSSCGRFFENEAEIRNHHDCRGRHYK